MFGAKKCFGIVPTKAEQWLISADASVFQQLGHVRLWWKTSIVLVRSRSTNDGQKCYEATAFVFFQARTSLLFFFFFSSLTFRGAQTVLWNFKLLWIFPLCQHYSRESIRGEDLDG